MTPQTIDVSGLSTAAVEAVGRVVALLRAGTAPAAGPPDPLDLTPEERSARWREFVRLGAVPGVVADDSRESIYDRSTE